MARTRDTGNVDIDAGLQWLSEAYVAFAALGSWLGAFASVTWLHRGGSLEPEDEHK